MRMDVVLSSIQSQGIATVLRSSVFAAGIIHCIIAIAMPHINELSSSSPAQDVSTARSDGKVHLLLAASGSVATIKIPNIIRGLSQHPNLSIRLVLTSSAAHFLQGQAEEQPSLAEIRKYPNVDAIYTDESEWVQPWTRGAPILHIELRKWADLLVIAPLSANTLAKMVHGISDSLLTSIILAWDTDGSVDGKKKKILVATAMNTAMFRSPITQRNLKTLNDLMGGSDGWVEELQTISKGLACGDVGQGGMATWETIVAAIQSKLGLTGAEENGEDETTAVKEEPSSSQKKGSKGNKKK
ncbi:flavoprotein [Trichoderma sp. SZMC 28014]